MKMPEMPGFNSPFKHEARKAFYRSKKFLSVIAILLAISGIATANALFNFSQILNINSGSNPTTNPLTGSQTLGPININPCQGTCQPIHLANAFTVSDIVGFTASFSETDSPTFAHNLIITMQPTSTSCPISPVGQQLSATSNPLPIQFSGTGVYDYCLYYDNVPPNESISITMNWSQTTSTVAPISGGTTLPSITVGQCQTGTCTPVRIANAFTVTNVTGNSAQYTETDSPPFTHSLIVTVQPSSSSCPATPTGSQITSTMAPVLFSTTGAKDYCLYFDNIPAGESISIAVSWQHS